MFDPKCCDECGSDVEAGEGVAKPRNDWPGERRTGLVELIYGCEAERPRREGADVRPSHVL